MDKVLEYVDLVIERGTEGSAKTDNPAVLQAN